MTGFRILLVLIFLDISTYTAVVVANHGIGLLQVFFGDIAAMGWAGQFNVDFMSYLLLSAFWIAWRHRFSAAGFGLAVLGLFGGALFLSAYLFVASFTADGDVKELLLGKVRAQA